LAPDTLGSLGGLACASAAPSAGGRLTTAGTFPVTCTGLTAPNYLVTYVAGKHTVAAGGDGGDGEGDGDGDGAGDGGAAPPGATTVVPARLLETRRGAGLETVDHDFEGGGRVADRAVIAVDVA